jgi:hypothetical protein
MELNRFKQLLESTMGDAKPLISEQEEMGYTVKNDATFENATSEAKPELKIFKGTKFVGVKLGYGPKDALKFEYAGKVTYNCAEGKFTVNASKDKYFQQYGGLTKALAPLCKTKVAPTNTETKSNHICDTDKTSQLQTGRSFKYCKNGEDYYFIGTAGEFQTKYPEWTQAKGTGLESIKTKIFYK